MEQRIDRESVPNTDEVSLGAGGCGYHPPDYEGFWLIVAVVALFLLVPLALFDRPRQQLPPPYSLYLSRESRDLAPAYGPPGLDRKRLANARFSLDIVEERRYQEALRDIAARWGPEGTTVVERAALVLEDDNPYDPGNAIRVDIGGRPVGYLKGEDASLYRSGEYPRECLGVIGGFELESGAPAHLSVKLELKLRSPPSAKP